MDINSWYAEISDKEDRDVLTVAEAPICQYLLLTSGKHKGRIFPKHYRKGQVDGRDIVHFSDRLTWVWYDTIEHDTCRRVLSPRF